MPCEFKGRFVQPSTQALGCGPNTVQLAPVRSRRGLALLESGQVQSLKEIAELEGVCNSYVSRMVNLTLLAPEIVAGILDDDLPKHITLFDLALDPLRLWEG